MKLLDPAPGSTVLELAAGPGDTGFLAAARVGPEGHLISSDFAPEMVETARRRGAELGVENATFVVLDGQALDLGNASVDAALCRWGYMLMPDPALGLAETRRVLRPGGRLAFAVWGRAEDNQWASALGRVLVSRGLVEPPEPDAPGPFRLHDPDRLRTLVGDAGLALLQLEDVAVSWRYASFDDYWETTADVSRALAAVLERVDREEARAVREAVARELSAYASGDGFVVPGVSRVVLARAG